MSSKLFSERLNRIARETQQIREHWDKRLVIPPTKFLEPYLSGHLHFHFHLASSENTDIPRSRFPRPLLFSESVRQRFGSEIHTHSEHCQDQFPVFVVYVHAVDEPKRITTRIGSSIRLQTVNSCKSTGTGDSLYLSAVTGHFVFCNRAHLGRPEKHGEFDLTRSGFCLEIGRRELPCEMVECRPQVMDNLSSEHTKSGLDDLSFNELSQFLKRFMVLLGEDWFDFFICDEANAGDGGQELSDLGIQVTDILIGPF